MYIATKDDFIGMTKLHPYEYRSDEQYFRKSYFRPYFSQTTRRYVENQLSFNEQTPLGNCGIFEYDGPGN